MSDVKSSGVGGSSIIAVKDGEITVGPESVGAAPGPACFGFGGTDATITDVNLLLGVLDPDTYLDGGFSLDAERSKTAIRTAVADPLGISVEEALVRMEFAYFQRIAESFTPAIDDPRETTIAAFGGAGPMSACGAAQLTGVHSVLIPKMAAVFSAFGIGFSDIAQSYEFALSELTAEAAREAHDSMLERAERDMFQEGYELAACAVTWKLVVEDATGRIVSESDYSVGDTPNTEAGQKASLTLEVRHALQHVTIDTGDAVTARPAVASGSRQVRSAADTVDEVSVYTLVDQQPGAFAEGPAIVEGPFYTARVLPGWTFEVSSAGDLLLTDLP